jgi:hypothetical protein
MPLILNAKSVEPTPAPLGLPTRRSAFLTLTPVQRPPEHPSMTTEFVEALRDFLNDPATKDAFRGLPSDFTRERCFTFPRICVALLKEQSRPAQTRLLHMFQEKGFGTVDKRPTASAFYQARAKVLPEFFHEWTRRAVQFFYDNFPRESLVMTWRGQRLWAVDCSTIILPDTPETRYFYSIQTNQIPDSETVCGLASFAYDVLNEMPTNACLEKVQAEKNLLFNHHFKHFSSDMIIIYDRGYADYAVVATHAMRGVDFVIRFPTSSTYKEVEEFVKSTENDRIVTLHATSHYRRQVNESVYPGEVQVRLVKVKLPTGETEVLMTSLLDQKKYKIADFKFLYGTRWGVETGFHRFKHELEVECFSSGKVNNIKQDFHAAVFLQVAETIMSKAQDRLIRARSIQDELEHVYHVNKSGAYTMLSDHLVGLFLLDCAEMLKHVTTYQAEIQMLKSPFRPGRHELRERLTLTRRLNYYLYRKKRGD